MFKKSSSSLISNRFPLMTQYKNLHITSNCYPSKIRNNIYNNDKCQKHQEPFIKYCTNCKMDICQYCNPLHDNHLLISYENIFPGEEEINLLKNTLKLISDDYSKLLEEILKWKNNLEDKIFYFERLIEKNEIINDVNYVYNFGNIKKNYLSIMKFRQIFSSVISPEKSNKNNNIMKITRFDKKYNMGYFNYYQYNLSKTLLELLINNNNPEDEYNKYDNNFIYKGNLIIKYLYDTYTKNRESNNYSKRLNKKININEKNRNSKSYYNTGTYSGSLRLNNEDDYYFNEKNKDRNYSNKQSKIIEKHIDLKMGSKKNIKKNINNNYTSSNLNTTNNTINNSHINNIFMKNNNNIKYNYLGNDKYDTDITDIYNKKTLHTSYSTKNLINNKVFNKNKLLSIKETNNKNKIYEKLISYTPITLSINDEINNKRVYSKKRYNNFNNRLNQTTINITNPFELQADAENNYGYNNLNESSINNNIISINIPKKTKYMVRSNSLNNINKNKFNPNKINTDIINTKIKQNEVIESRYIPEIRPKNLIYNSKIINNINKTKNGKNNTSNININTINNTNNNIKENKQFQHKKLNNNFEVIRNFNNDSDKLNQTQLYNKPGDHLQEEQLNNSNILNNTFTQSYPFNSNKQKNIIISKKNKQSDTNIHFIKNEENSQIKSSIFPNSQKNSNNKKNQPIFTIKNNQDTKYLINHNIPICLGLDLDNSYCKLSLVNQNNGNIELFCFGKEQYSIPSIIGFNDNNEIIIGKDAEISSITNPNKTIFNLLKMVGKNYCEIKGMKEIWPFKIYSDGDFDRPYIKINFTKKEKKFYVEDLLSLYLKILFEKFFKKLIISENPNENKNMKEKYFINIILVIAVPNNLNYFQRKVIEKIFQRQIFPKISIEKEKDNKDNKNNSNNMINTKKRLYNGFQINLKKVKIENASSIASLCLNGSEKNESNNKNSLIISIGGGSTNMSITSINTYINKKIYNVKALNSAEFGEEDFTDIFVNDILKEFDQNMYKQCMSKPGTLAKLRRSCTLAKKHFDNNPQVQIKVSKLCGDIDLNMTLIKSDYEKACNDLFIKINILLKEILIKAKLSEICIDNILLIGSTSRTDKIKNILKEIFKHNRFLYNKLCKSLSSDKDNDLYIVIGAAIQASNLTLEEPKYVFNDITPMSFGVETMNGLMEFVVEKGTNIPVQKEKLIKIKNDGEQCLKIKIYEGEDNAVNRNRLISSANIDKRNFKSEKIGIDFIEILIQFEIDSNLNLCVYVLDVKTLKRRFECLINIDVVKS